jgi:hypothetical protein
VLFLELKELRTQHSHSLLTQCFSKRMGSLLPLRQTSFNE